MKAKTSLGMGDDLVSFYEYCPEVKGRSSCFIQVRKL